MPNGIRNLFGPRDHRHRGHLNRLGNRMDTMELTTRDDDLIGAFGAAVAAQADLTISFADDAGLQRTEPQRVRFVSHQLFADDKGAGITVTLAVMN